MARDLGLPSSTLEAFAEGKVALPPQVLQALTLELFQGAAVYDPELDLLRSANRAAPRSLGIRPPSVAEMGLTLPKFKGGAPEHAYRPVQPTLPVTKMKRAGWVEE